MPIEELLDQVGLAVGKFYDWRKRYGAANRHNGKAPRDFWLLDWEKQKILAFQTEYPDVGYRCLTYMLIDVDIVAVYAYDEPHPSIVPFLLLTYKGETIPPHPSGAPRFRSEIR